MGIEDADLETIRRYVDTVFSVDVAGLPDEPRQADVTLRLVEVTDEGVSSGFQQFSLFFHGPADRLLPQQLYTMQHDALGSQALFIVPVLGSNSERVIYQACFSRPVRPSS